MSLDNFDDQIGVVYKVLDNVGEYKTYKESIQFYRISRGSMFELKDHLITCNDLNYISLSIYEKGEVLIESSIKTLNGYIGYVNKLNKGKR